MLRVLERCGVPDAEFGFVCHDALVGFTQNDRGVVDRPKLRWVYIKIGPAVLPSKPATKAQKGQATQKNSKKNPGYAVNVFIPSGRIQ